MPPKKRKPIPGDSKAVLNDRAVDKSRKPKEKATAKATKVLNTSEDDDAFVEPEDLSEADVDIPRSKIGPPGKADGSGRGDWAVGPITDAKDAYEKELKALGAWWQKGVLHHLISKEKLSSIGEQLAKACHSNDGTDQGMAGLQKAALDFWYLCCQLAGEHVCEAVRQGTGTKALNPVRLLWNMPIMVSLGPPNPTTDPGQNFDPDTELDPRGGGIRRLTETSELLRQLEAIWDAADAGTGNYSVAMWRDMHTCLSAAHKASKKRRRGARLLYPPISEQWLYDTAKRVVIRKGLVKFLGVEAGIQLFRAARYPEGAALSKEDFAVLTADTQILGADAVMWDIKSTCTILLNDVKTKLVVQVTAASLQHICRRHTLTFFAFDEETERPINTLWLGGTTFKGMRKMVKTCLMPDVVKGCIREVRLLDERNIVRGTEIDVGHVPNPPWGTLYMKINISTLADDVILAEVKTIAPDGPQALGFLRSELEDINAALRPHRGQ